MSPYTVILVLVLRSVTYQYCHMVCSFVVLRHSKTTNEQGSNLWKWALKTTLWYCLIGKPSHRPPDLITWYPTQSHYADTEPPPSHCPRLIMPSTWLGSDEYRFNKSFVWLNHGFEPMISHHTSSAFEYTFILVFSFLWFQGYSK